KRRNSHVYSFKMREYPCWGRSISHTLSHSTELRGEACHRSAKASRCGPKPSERRFFGQAKPLRGKTRRKISLSCRQGCTRWCAEWQESTHNGQTAKFRLYWRLKLQRKSGEIGVKRVVKQEKRTFGTCSSPFGESSSVYLANFSGFA